MVQNRLDNKNVLITGASKGLGYVCAKALERENANLILIARSKDKLTELKSGLENPNKHLCIGADLTDSRQLHESLKEAVEFAGKIDVVLHVLGGGLGFKDPLLSLEELEKLFVLNLGIAAQINRIVAPQMIQRGFGNLVHVCSIASSESTGSVGYNTVKAALAAYVRSLGRELAGSKVIVTGILPGGFYAPENHWERKEKQEPEVVKRFVEERLPRKILGVAEEITPLVCLLCSEEASMMGGCLVPIDAGEGKAYLVH